MIAEQDGEPPPRLQKRPEGVEHRFVAADDRFKLCESGLWISGEGRPGHRVAQRRHIRFGEKVYRVAVKHDFRRTALGILGPFLHKTYDRVGVRAQAEATFTSFVPFGITAP